MKKHPFMGRRSKRALATLTAFTLIAGALLVTGTSAQAAVAPISVPPLPSVYSASTTYSLTVNGIPVPVVGYAGYDYAQFSMGSGTAQIVVTKLNGTDVGAAYISPIKQGYKATLSGNKATFTIPVDEYLIVKLDGQRRLVIAADPAETDKPASSGTGIFNVTWYNADWTGSMVTTSAVQAALDAASAYGSQPGNPRGIVYIPRGVYTVGNLVLKSNTSVYLEPGAVLRVKPDTNLYSADAVKTSQGNRKLTWWIRTAFGSRNIKLYGRGTLDGNGMAATQAGFGMNILAPIATSDFTLDGLTIREAASWAVIPTRSNNLSFTNMKIFNRFDMGENDGIDVIESQDVTVHHGIGIALDDPYTTKSWPKGQGITINWPGDPEVVRNVVFDDLISWTYCYGFKVGQGVVTDHQGVVFKNSVVYDSSVALGVHHRAGTGAATDVTFYNIDIERVTNTNDSKRTWFALMVEDAYLNGGGPISNVKVSHINVRDDGTTPGKMTGYSPSASISGVRFDSIKMPGSTTYATTLAEMNITDRSYVSGVTILPVQNPEP